MRETDRLNSDSDRFELGFAERESTLEPAMKLGIRLHLAGLSLSNTISIFNILGVERCRSTVHNWVQKADLQPTDGADPDHVAVDETMIRLNDQRFWLYAAVNPETNHLLHVKLSPTRNLAITEMLLAELRKNISSFARSFSSTLHRGCKRRSTATASITNTKNMVIGILSNVSFEN